MKVEFSPERRARFDALVAKYERKQSALLPTLYLAQEQWGYLTPEAMDYVGELLEIPPAHVYDAASFYLLFRKKDMGQWFLQVCNNVTCTMLGSEALLAVIQEELGIGNDGSLSADGKFSCIAVQCLGSCDTAPVVQVNEEYVEKLTPDRLRALVRRLREGGTLDAFSREADL